VTATRLLKQCSDCTNLAEVDHWKRLTDAERDTLRAAVHSKVAENLRDAANRMQRQHGKNSPWPRLPPLTPVLRRDNIGDYSVQAIVLVAYETARH
jgi:hypothetical protein